MSYSASARVYSNSRASGNVHQNSAESQNPTTSPTFVNGAQPSRTVHLADNTQGRPLYVRPETSMQALMEAAPGEEPQLSSEDLEDGDPRCEVIDAAIRQLTPRQREVFLLYEVEGLDQPQIAERLGIRQQSVAEHLEKAKGNLRRLLEHNPIITLHWVEQIADNDQNLRRRNAAARLLAARWRLARALAELEDIGVPLDKLAEAIGLDTLTASFMVKEYRNG